MEEMAVRKILLIALVLLTPLPALAQTVGHRVIVIANFARLRDQGRVIDVVDRGKQLLVERVGTETSRFKLLGHQLWINRSDVYPLDLEIEPFPKPMRRNSNERDEKVVIIAKQTQLKRASDDVATIHRGDHLSVKEFDRDRYFVRWHGAECWISRREAIPSDLGIDYFTAAIERERNAVDLVARGRLWADQAEFDDANADLNEAIELQPKFANAYVGRADVWYAQGKLNEALADFDKAIDIDPENSAAYAGRAMVRHVKGDLDAALADYAEAIRLDPTDATTYCNQAALFGTRGDFDKAMASLSQAIRIDPNDPAIDAVFGTLFYIDYTQRASALNGKAALDYAIARYDAAIRLDPTKTTAFLNRATAWLGKNEYNKAIADYNEAIRIGSTRELAFVLRGLAWEARGDVDRAESDYTVAVQMNPKNAMAYLLRGNVREADKAIPDLFEAIRLDPTLTRAYVYLASAYATIRRYDKAVEWQEKAVELSPESEISELETQLKHYQRLSPRPAPGKE
jgi:tetratricopeptide (TPR) repeat protein